MIQFSTALAEIYVPDGSGDATALARTTHLGIAAHHDDLEIMAIDGILHCFRQEERWFTGVVVTDGRASPRTGSYASFSAEEMTAQRAREQREAADMGEYSAVALLAHQSEAIKKPGSAGAVADIARLLEVTTPEVVYTHNPADKHDTHVAVLLCVLEAIDSLDPKARPRRLYGCEVWRDLDWLPDDRKVVFDCSAHEVLQAGLVKVFKSQIEGGKRYDLAVMGRRRAHAAYLHSHEVDSATALAYGIDLTPLIQDQGPDLPDFVDGLLSSFADDVRARLGRLGHAK